MALGIGDLSLYNPIFNMIGVTKLEIHISNDGIKLTNVPSEDQCSKERKYYVYEWFIKDTDEVFYVGKGTGRRYLQDKNTEFLKVKNAYDCDVRIINDQLNEYDALQLEENLILQRYDEGNVLTNVQIPNGHGVYNNSQILKYMRTPKIHVNRVDEHDLKIVEPNYDEINLANLLKTYILPKSSYGTGRLYFNDGRNLVPQEECEQVIESLKEKVKQFIKDNVGKVYKSKAKSIKSIIDYTVTPYENYSIYKQNDYDVYHMIDVLKYIDNN